MKALKRMGIILLGCALVLSVVTGCSKGKKSASGADKKVYTYTRGETPVELTFWTSTVDDVNAELVKNFNETKGKELNIHVNVEFQGSYWDMQKKINAAAVAGTLPNAFIDEVSMTRGFAENNIIEDLSPFIDANNIDTQDFEIGDQGNLYYEGDRYAYPHMRSVPVMYVNKLLVEKLGLSAEGPKTFDELETYLQTCYSVTGQPGMYIFNYDLWVMEALLHSFSDVSVLNEDETKTNINSDGAVALVEYMDRLQEKGYIKILNITDSDSFYAALAKPTTALTFTSIGGYIVFSNMAKQANGVINVSMIPSGTEGTRGVPVGGSNTFLSNTGSDNEKAAAFQFLTWLTAPAQSAYASAKTGYLPTSVKAYDEDIMKQTVAAYPGFKVAFDELQYCKMRPTIGSYHEIEDLMCSKINQIWLDNLPVKESLDKLAADVDDILSRD
ncbi:MAG: extracellular solute-binding protein [Spirochaetales bacterium]|nr:extracellular solute-binding protein [Spirochaetales bacterium]